MNVLRAGVLVAGAVGSLTCAGEEPDWWRCQRDLTSMLFSSNTPIAKVVGRVSSQPAVDGSSAMFKVAVLMRAGMTDAAIGALRELKWASPDLSGSQIAGIYYDACEREGAWEVAQALAEVFAGNITELSMEGRLLKHWMDSGWPLEKVDAWFAARPVGVGSFWVKERLRFALSNGRGEALIEELSDGVRQRRDDVTNAVVFLDALLYARRGGQETDLSWFKRAVEPVRALDAGRLGDRLQRLEKWDLALAYFETALSIPLTAAEVSELGRMRQALMFEATLRVGFEAQVRESMAACLLKLGRADEAQERMVEAADLREEHGLGGNPLFAGQVQSASGQRTMERRITGAEKASKEDPEYWRDQARYYRGREETAQEEAALRRGLAVVSAELPPDRPGKGHIDWRSGLLADYAQFLSRQRRDEEAVALLLEELLSSPPASESSGGAAWLLASDYGMWIKAEDPVLWRWLARRPVWGHREERLLWRLLGNAPQETFEPLLTRAEGLVEEGDPSRAFTLGWIFNRLGLAERSLPLLRQAVAETKDEKLKQCATFALLESCLDTGRWKEGEEVFPGASLQLTALELPQWHSRLALAAARAGAPEDALRLWARTANVSPTAQGNLVELAGLGLGEELRRFYRGMREELPGSRVPSTALGLLGARQ